MAMANVINIVMDRILIFGINGHFAFGIKGAAAATLLGQTVAMVVLLVLVLRTLEIDLRSYMKDIRLDPLMLKRILRVGGFSVAYGITRPFTGLLMYKAAAQSGTEAIAAFKVGGMLLSLLFILIGGLEVAISIMVGQNLGKKDLDKIDKLMKTGMKLAFASIAVLAIPYFILPRLLMMIFSRDAAVIEIGIRYLRIVYLGLLSLTFTTVFNAAFRGAGDNFPPMVGALVANWLVKIPVAYYLVAKGFGSNGVWFAIAVSIAVEAAIAAVFFARGSWKTKKV